MLGKEGCGAIWYCKEYLAASRTLTSFRKHGDRFCSGSKQSHRYGRTHLSSLSAKRLPQTSETEEPCNRTLVSGQSASKHVPCSNRQGPNPASASSCGSGAGTTNSAVSARSCICLACTFAFPKSKVGAFLQEARSKHGPVRDWSSRFGRDGPGKRQHNGSAMSRILDCYQLGECWLAESGSQYRREGFPYFGVQPHV